jgi:putative glutamine amidotransferase
MGQPRIGVTTSHLRNPGYYDPYLRAVEAAGGAPVPLAAWSSGQVGDPAEELIGEVDGLLVPGGWDIDPTLYGEEPAPDASERRDPELDRSEIALVRCAVRRAVPVLGICRGQQVINVALGGSLHQHVDGHDMHGKPRSLLAHRIDITPQSELGAAVGSRRLRVNSLHHQAVKDLAPSLRLTARSADGIVEGVETTDGRVVAVQCHPEELIDAEPWALSLLRRFVARAQFASGKAAAPSQVAT